MCHSIARVKREKCTGNNVDQSSSTSKSTLDANLHRINWRTIWNNIVGEVNVSGAVSHEVEQSNQSIHGIRISVEVAGSGINQSLVKVLCRKHV